MADRNLLKRLKKIDCYRIPLSYYLPKELLTPEILEEEKGLKEEGIIYDIYIDFKQNEFAISINNLWQTKDYIGTIVTPHRYSWLAGIRYCESGIAPQLSYPPTPICFISMQTSTKFSGVISLI